MFDPQTWIDLLTVHALKADMFSARTLMVIHEGIEKLAAARNTPNSGIRITSSHTILFERLQRAFNNPNLLKEVGIAYLEEFGLPAIAQKHFELAHSLAPKDRDIEQYQVSAALAVAKKMSDQSTHSGLNEAAPSTPEVQAVLRRTSKLAHVVDTRKQLDETADEMGRQQEVWRKTGTVVTAPEDPKPDYHEHLDRVAELMAVPDFAEVSVALNEAQVAGAPREELQAYYAQLGLAAYDHGYLEVALNAFLHLRDLSPDAIEGWFNCGLVYQKMGRMDDARASYMEAIRVAPDNPKTWCNLSAVWFEAGNPEEAEKTARRSIELKDDYARAWDNLASALSAQNRLPEAADACRKAIKIQPALLSAWFKYGVVNFQLDNMVMAMEAFNVSGASPELFAYGLYYLAMIDARKGELEAAVEKLVEARAAGPGDELETSAMKEIAAAYVKAGDYSSAASYYRQVTELHPDDFSAWLSLGTSEHRAEHFDAARESYQRATEVEPENPVPWHNLGLLASDLKQHDEARKCFQREVELSPDDAKAWYDLGVSLEALGLKEESTNAYEHAEDLVRAMARRSSDLSAALSIVRRLNLGERVIKTE